MPENRIFVTKEGLEKLQQEYEQLVKKERPALSERLKLAREAGDLSENADYESAREKQAFVEGRISELAQMLKKVEIVAQANDSRKVGVGNKVKLMTGNDRLEFELVGAPEADPLKGRISYESPLGKELLGKAVGEIATVETPAGGQEQYKILEVV